MIQERFFFQYLCKLVIIRYKSTTGVRRILQIIIKAESLVPEAAENVTEKNPSHSTCNIIGTCTSIIWKSIQNTTVVRVRIEKRG